MLQQGFGIEEEGRGLSPYPEQPGVRAAQDVPVVGFDNGSEPDAHMGDIAQDGDAVDAVQVIVGP
jgi:hypothetical protein